jgi:hypothetical protein
MVVLRQDSRSNTISPIDGAKMLERYVSVFGLIVELTGNAASWCKMPGTFVLSFGVVSGSDDVD